jgi:hypothetical protein
VHVVDVERGKAPLPTVVTAMSAMHMTAKHPAPSSTDAIGNTTRSVAAATVSTSASTLRRGGANRHWRTPAGTIPTVASPLPNARVVITALLDPTVQIAAIEHPIAQAAPAAGASPSHVRSHRDRLTGGSPLAPPATTRPIAPRAAGRSR